MVSFLPMETRENKKGWVIEEGINKNVICLFVELANIFHSVVFTDSLFPDQILEKQKVFVFNGRKSTSTRENGEIYPPWLSITEDRSDHLGLGDVLYTSNISTTLLLFCLHSSSRKCHGMMNWSPYVSTLCWFGCFYFVSLRLPRK